MDSSYSSSSYNPMKTSYTNPFPENDIHCSSTLDEEEEDPYHTFMFNFPNSPHIHLEYEDAYLQFLDLFYQHQSSDHDHTNIPHHEHDQDPNRNTQTIIPNTLDHHHNNNQTSTTTTKKRCSKKDRHSKINTARGLRDRRMRLSLDVARKFFDLQDLLGYDKASRTVDWLLNSAMPSIRELEISRGSACSRVGSSTSVDDCDVASSSINQSTTVGSDQELPPSSSSTKIKRIKKIIKVARTSVSRESRIKARERARERVGQKRRLESQNTDEFRQPRSDHEAVRVLAGADQQGGDESLVYTRPWSSAGFSHQHHQQIAEYFHACSKPWEADNTFNLS